MDARTLRVLIFSEFLYPHGGGAELATSLYSNLLAEKGLDVTIVTRMFPGESQMESPNRRTLVYRIPMKAITGSRYDTLANAGILASTYVRKLIAETDLVYLPAGWYDVSPMARLYKKPIVVHLHNYSIVCPTSLMYDYIRQEPVPSSRKSFILHEVVEKKRGPFAVAASSFLNETIGRHYSGLGTLADALIFVSNEQLDLVVSRIPHVRKKSHLIYNPIPNHQLVEAERKGVGYFGGTSFTKGFHVLMRALRSLREGNIRAYVTMVPGERKTLRLDNGVLANFLPKIDPVSIMRDLAIVVVPSLSPEPSPYILVESMLTGKLIVASGIGGIPEITGGSSKGVGLVAPGSQEEILEALDRFLALSMNEINEIGMNNRDIILQRFSNEESVQSLLRVFTEVAS